MSVIALDELCRVVDTVVGDTRLTGAVNAVSPEPVRNAAFAAALGRSLRRPAWVRTPAWLIRGLLGEMGLGNTAVASLLLARLCGVSLQDCTGAGTGLDAAGVERKRAVLAQALAKAPEQRYASGREFADALRAAVREVQHETIQQLVAQARTSLARDEFDAAETNLKQALAIRADDEQAQHLLAQVAERREISQRYAALAQTVAQARTAAADLAQRDPHLQDPAGALALFARPAVAAAPAPGQVALSGPSLWMQRFAAAEMTTRLVGAFLFVLGVYLATFSSPSPIPESDQLSAMRFGHALWGFGLGLSLLTI